MAASPRKKSKNSTLNRTEKRKDPIPTSSTPPTLNAKSIPVVRSVCIILISLFSLNLARSCCLTALHPLFGSIATNYNFETGIRLIDFLIAPIINLLCPNLSPSSTAGNFLAAFLVWRAPDNFGRILAKYSSRFDILYGPSIFQSIGYWPIRLAGMCSIYQLALNLVKQHMPFSSNRVVRKTSIVSLPVVLHGLSCLMLPLANKCFQSLPASQIFNLTPVILLATTMIGSMIEISQLKLSKTIAIKKINIIIIFGCILSAIYMPLPKKISHELDLKTRSTIHPADYRTLARRLSITGLVLIGEYTQDSGSQFRFLRCDHSLLGGIWNGLARKEILKQQKQSTSPITIDELETQSVEKAEAIYPTFIIQTAVRLVERSQSNRTVTNEKRKALLLGLGAGIAARLLIKQDVAVTVVEIDPLIYEYSRKYFGLPTLNGGIFLEDARIYLDRKIDEAKPEVFDYVIHDVFTGGTIPSSLFTLECWRGIRSKLKDDGVLVVNFVGRPLSDAASMVFITLFQVFPFCRAFSEDSGGPISTTDFQNTVIFCSPKGKPEFREAVESDVLGSSEYQLRVLNSFRKHEIDLTKLLSDTKKKGEDVNQKDLILSDKNRSKLDRAQVEIGLHHWEIMRKALPDHVWNNYYDQI